MSEDLSKYTFVKWGKKLHMLDENSDLCCGKVPRRALHMVPPPEDKSEICIICWWNRDRSNND